jgi:phosphohistidine swiveling domain-containing protein
VDGPLPLTDSRCQDPSWAGAKAARLAQARAAGLPVLPGLVVPVPAGTRPLAEARALVATRGAAAARLAVMDTDPKQLARLPRLAAELAETLVVRSSSPLEDTGVWSGAFTSFLDVAPHEVLTAVKGVWASALSEDVLGRLARAAPEGAAAGLAVLIQPAIQPAYSGTARVGASGEVAVVVVAGPPARLTAGWDRGEVARVAAGGGVTGVAAVALAGDRLLSRVADLARRVRRELGDNAVEWAALGADVVLLQSRAGAAARDPADLPTTPAGPLPDNALAVARFVMRYAGATGQALVLPWLVCGPVPCDITPGPIESGDPLAAWAEAVRLAGELCPEGAGRDVARLRGDRPADALRRLAGRPAVDGDLAARALARFEFVARALMAARVLTHPRQLWSLPPDSVSQLLAGAAPADGAGPDAAARARLHWQRFVHTAVMAGGTRVAGDPAAPGRRVGPAAFVAGGADALALPAGAVLITRWPLPHLAPLLWGASALVSIGGSPAAHLLEVARSLAVPAVVGCRLDDLLHRDGHAPLIAVDGDAGVVAVG